MPFSVLSMSGCLDGFQVLNPSWTTFRMKFCWRYFPYWISEESKFVAKFPTDSVLYRMTNHYGKGWVVIVFCVARKFAPRTFRFQCAPSLYNGRTLQPHAHLFGSKLNFEGTFCMKKPAENVEAIKVHTFWEGHKIFAKSPPFLTGASASQKKVEISQKCFVLLRIYELYCSRL